MAQDLVPSGGSDGTLLVTVDSRQAVIGITAIEERMLRMGQTVNSGLSRMSSNFDKFTSFIKKAAVAVGAFMTIRSVIGLFNHLISRIIEVNRVYVGFIASMSIIKGSTQAATKEYEFLLAISNKLGVAVETSISQYHRLAAALKNVDTTGELTRHIFAGLSSAAVVLQSKGRDVTLIFEAVQQMASKGKLSLEELQRQLGNTLPGAMSLAARAMMNSQQFIEKGVKTAAESERELRKGIEKGTINVYEFLARLSNQLKKEYGSGVEYASTQFQANFNRMRNAVFEFYRMVGSSKAMEGLTTLLREITALFNDANGMGAEGLGKGLGNLFTDMAKWVSQLDSSDVQEFFETVSVSMSATRIVVAEFLDAFKGIGGPEMQTPLLNFVEFSAKTLAALVDVFRVAVAGIEMAIRGIIDLFYSAREAVYGISDFTIGASEKLGEVFPSLHNSTDKRIISEYKAKRAAQQQARDANAAALGASANTFFFGPEQNAFDQVSGAFDGARNNLLAKKYGVSSELNFSVPGTASIDPATGMPSYMAYQSGKAGSTADEASKYMNPLGDMDLQLLIDKINANSNAPNGGGGGKPKRDPVQSNFLREQTRLLKDISTAEVGYQNVLANRNLFEGENVAQMRSLIATDERYMKLSGEKKARLMELAKQLDEVTLRVENAKKAQAAYSQSLQDGFDVEARIGELRSTGYESKYRAVTDTQNSFKEGGENQFMDEANRQKMLSASMKQDADQRSLDMEKYIQQISQANDEMRFQADLSGMSKFEIQKATEFRKIDLTIAAMMVGATQQQQAEYLKLAEILKNDVAGAMDYVQSKQNDLLGGIKQGYKDYVDSISDFSGQMRDITVNAFTGMEDAFVQFVETGKLSFKELTQSIAKDLVRLIYRYLLVWFLQKMTGLASTGSGDGSIAGFGNNVDGMMSQPGGSWGTFMGGSAKGNVFEAGNMKYFAKGGVFDQPTVFPLKGGYGTAFEAGPEAVMPLARDKSGNLGVKVASGGGDSDPAVLNLTVEVYQGKGDGVTTEQGQNEQGDVLKIFIGEVAADIQRGGQVAKSLSQTYGLSRKPRSYS